MLFHNKLHFFNIHCVIVLYIITKRIYLRYLLVSQIPTYKLVGSNFLRHLHDYFATVEEFRGQGIGSEFLTLLHDKVSDVEMILCEAETPDGTTGDEYNIRSRRIAFYLNNNFIDTGVTASAFNVDFVLLELDIGSKHSLTGILLLSHSAICSSHFLCSSSRFSSFVVIILTAPFRFLL